jgi:hypothetical protein
MKSLVAFAFLSLTFSGGGSDPGQAKGRDKQLEMATCLYQKHPANVDRLLKAKTAQDADHAFYNLVNESGCYRQVFGGNPGTEADEVRMTIGTMRGLFAEQELRKAAAAARALSPLPQQRLYVRPWFVGTARAQIVDEMAACIADTNPAGIVALLDSGSDSAAEDSALKGLEPSVDRCLPKGAQISATHRQVRAALADALYQRVSAPTLSYSEIVETPR